MSSGWLHRKSKFLLFIKSVVQETMLDRLVERFAPEKIKKEYYLRQLAKEIEHPTFSDASRNFCALELIALGGGAVALGTGLAGCSVAAIQSSWDSVYGPYTLANFEGHKRRGGSFTFLGIDYSVPIGTTVVAVADGQILNVEVRSLGGLSVWQDNGDGYVSVYMHLDKALVEPLQFVKRGEPVAKSGNSGRTGNPMHLHYGIRRLFVNELLGLPGTIYWIDPDTLGEGGDRLKYYKGNPITDTIAPENRIYLMSLMEKLLKEYKGGAMPDGLKEYFYNFNEDFRSAAHPTQIKKLLTDYKEYFNNGTLERYEKEFEKMRNLKLPPPVLTHPIQNPSLINPKTLNSR